MSSKERNKKMKRTMLGMTLVLVLGALVLAGCGGSSGGGSTETSTTASTGSESSESTGSESSTAEGKAGGMMNISEEAKKCLKEKGVELPEFKGGEGGPPSGEPPAGAEAGEMPEGGEPPAGAEGGEKPEGGPPAGVFGGEGNEEMQKAFEECGVEMPEFKGGPGGANVNSAAFRKQVKEYVACVKENGYQLAAPNFSGEGPIFEKSESESAAFKKASASCQSLLGGPGGSQSG
jgi:predicted small secreted protein